MIFSLTENGNGALLETLRAYLDSDLDVARTADALYVHPNTVRYRLRRISELTGLDTQRFSGQVELLTIARLSEADPG
jgi:DNA-binding PucR family transcriptional regulator